jgi:2'-5' RNA ligase
MPWFSSESDGQAIEIFNNSIVNSNQIQITPKGSEMFGYQRTIKVLEVNRSEELSTIHSQIYETINRYRQRLLVNSEFTLKNYRPHITFQHPDDESNLTMQKVISIDKIALISKPIDSKVKVILATQKLEK